MTAALGFVLGLLLGSFVEAAAERSLKKESLWGRSYCQRCKHTLGWYDLFPVFSYLLLRGRCRWCRKPIPLSHLITELILGLGTALLFLTLPPLESWPWQSVGLQEFLFWLGLSFKLFTLGVLGIVFLTDMRTGFIPDRITYPAVGISFAYLAASSSFSSFIFYQSLSQNPLGKYLMSPYSNYLSDTLWRIWQSAGWSVGAAVLAALIFALLIIATKGRGMGWGDVKYVLFLGLALGFPKILPALFLAFFCGAAFSLVLILLRRKRFGQTVPFGPFLSVGAFLALLWGSEIINWYLSFSPGG